MVRSFHIVGFCIFLASSVLAQERKPGNDIESLKSELSTLRTTELVMSMAQRSLVMPSYLGELKALIAKQAYDFWRDRDTEPYVSHLNVYNALHYANKYLDYDSARMLAYNQVGGHTEMVTSIAFGTNPNYYYSSSSDGEVLKWNLNNAQELPQTVYTSDKIIRSVDISFDGQWLLVVSLHSGVSLVALENSPDNEILTLDDPEPVQTAVFLPATQEYLIATRDGQLKVKGFQTRTIEVGQSEGTVMALEVQEDTRTFFAGTQQGNLEQWEEQSYFGYDLGHHAINCLDISPDGTVLAIGRERGDAILWNIEQERLERVISGHQSAITDIQFSPNNQLLLTTSRDRTARLWDLDDSRKLPTIMDDHDDWVMTGSFDPSGNRVITGCKDEYIRIWPTSPDPLAQRICEMMTRGMSQDEWEEFVGLDIPYRPTCD